MKHESWKATYAHDDECNATATCRFKYNTRKLLMRILEKLVVVDVVLITGQIESYSPSYSMMGR